MLFILCYTTYRSPHFADGHGARVTRVTALRMFYTAGTGSLTTPENGWEIF